MHSTETFKIPQKEGEKKSQYVLSKVFDKIQHMFLILQS